MALGPLSERLHHTSINGQARVQKRDGHGRTAVAANSEARNGGAPFMLLVDENAAV